MLDKVYQLDVVSVSVMATTENTEQNTNKVAIGAKVDPRIYAVIERLSREDERSISNTVERLLKQSPLIQESLEADSAVAV